LPGEPSMLVLGRRTESAVNGRSDSAQCRLNHRNP
jgi:hypothetical protein